jgi:hypothetical protein
MLAFRKFVKLVKDNRVLVIGTEAKYGEARWELARPGGEELKILKEAMKSVQLFVFEAHGAEFDNWLQAELGMMKVDDVQMPTEEEIKDRKQKSIEHEEATLDVPFQSTFFEAVHPDHQGIVLGRFGFEQRDAKTKRSLGSEVIMSTGPMLIFESEPKKYWKFEYAERPGHDPAILAWKVSESKRQKDLEKKDDTLAVYLKKLRTGLLAHEVVDEKFRFQVTATSDRTKKRDYVKINTIIRVIAKDRRSVTKPLVAKEINWTHRWLVRGHWVTFWQDDAKTLVDYSKIGKDRSGEYYVKGYTWRVEHEKGPDEAPLIANKTRIVK